jgi:hypothetical protein
LFAGAELGIEAGGVWGAGRAAGGGVLVAEGAGIGAGRDVGGTGEGVGAAAEAGAALGLVAALSPLSMPPWWLQAPFPALPIVPSLHFTGTPASAEPAGGAALTSGAGAAEGALVVRVVGRMDMVASQLTIATVTIDRAAGLFEVRPCRRRRVYALPLATVADMVVRDIIKAEVRARKEANKRR